jgi:signal transduction histidine kinase
MSAITPKPIASRIFQIFLLGNLVSLVILLAFAWWALETLESTAIESDRRIELDHFQHYGDKTKPHRITLSQQISIFQPKGIADPEALPIVFQNIPVPFQGEVEVLDRGYSVITYAFPEGTLFLAKDLRQFEEQEKTLIISVLVLALIITFASVALAYFASRKISGPIARFTDSVGDLKSGNSIVRIDQTFPDTELNQIAIAVNTLIEQIDNGIKHEKNFIAMTSHELRTPIAVVLGAVNVLEKRGNLGEEDQKTLQRIKNAINEMSENTQALLSLVRASKNHLNRDAFDLAELIRKLCDNHIAENPAFARRLAFHVETASTQIHSDPVLVRILVHNLISNALRHTTGPVVIRQHADRLEIHDQGEAIGMLTRITDAQEIPASAGLGLYIVRLACEALGWPMTLTNHAPGNHIQLWFHHNPSPAPVV